jgi:hypothetical protein
MIINGGIMELEFDYIKDRLDDQYQYFNSSALKNQKNYRRLKKISVICNILTTFTIALIFALPDSFRIFLSLSALAFSTLVLATYQWEEFQNYGAKWEKFRLVAEQLKSEKSMYLSKVGNYNEKNEQSKELLVETVENIIRGTDLSYFTLLVDPGRRIEKRLSTKA